MEGKSFGLSEKEMNKIRDAAEKSAKEKVRAKDERSKEMKRDKIRRDSMGPSVY